MNKEFDEEERQKILDAVSKFLNRDNIYANKIVTYPHTPSIGMDSIGDTNPNDIVHLYFDEHSDFINGEFKRKKCLVADYWVETNILWHSALLPMEQFSEAYKMFFDKYEQLDGDKIPKEEIEKYRKELEMWWGKRKEEEQEQEQEKELIIKNAFEFLKRDDLILIDNDVVTYQFEDKMKLKNYEVYEMYLYSNNNGKNTSINIVYKTEKRHTTFLYLNYKENQKLTNLFTETYKRLKAQQEQAEHQDYYINEFYKFIKQDDLVAGFENKTKFIMSSDKNLSNSKIKKICLYNNELIAYFENYMFTFKDNYSLYDDFLFKFNELLNKQIGEVEKLAELDVKDAIRKIEENTTRKSYFADCINKEFNQPQDTTDYTIKYDQNKHKLSQFPREAMEAVVEVMEYGARKYGKGSWNRVEVERYIDAAARHLYAMQDIDENGRECINLSKKDDESGLEHLYHLACNVVYAVALYRRGKNEKGLYVIDPQKDLTFLTEDNIDKYVDDMYRREKND